MIHIEQAKCTGCGQCANDCVASNISLLDGKAQSSGPCILCGHCVAVCPSEAVSIPEYDMEDVELCDQARFGFEIDTFVHTVKCRRSIRQYTGQPVERAKLEHIIQAGRYTATGSNSQSCRFIVVQDSLPALKDILWDGIDTAVQNQPDAFPAGLLASLQRFTAMRAQGTDYLFRDAPAVLYIASESPVDAALAAQNMEMAAISQGLGVLYNGFLVYAAQLNPAACEWLDVQKKPIAVCMLLGYPKVAYRRSAPRKAADVRWR